MSMARSIVVAVSLIGLASAAMAQTAGVVVDATGQVVGAYADQGMVHSHSGYRFRVDFHSGRVAYPRSADPSNQYPLSFITDISGAYYGPHAFFLSDDCSGDPLLAACPPEGGLCAFTWNTYVLPAGIVVDLGSGTFGDPEAPYDLYFVPRNTEATAVEVLSTRSSPSSCSSTQQERFVVPTVPNDPSVTGVPNEPFTPPLKLEMRPFGALFDLFKNGFESSMVFSARTGSEPHSNDYDFGTG